MSESLILWAGIEKKGVNSVKLMLGVITRSALIDFHSKYRVHAINRCHSPITSNGTES